MTKEEVKKYTINDICLSLSVFSPTFIYICCETLFGAGSIFGITMYEWGFFNPLLFIEGLFFVVVSMTLTYSFFMILLKFILKM